MRSPILLLIIIFVSACSQQRESAMRAELDSLQAVIQTHDAQTPEADSAIYVGPIMPFDETKEFYTSLYTLGDLKAFESKYIQSELDSVIYDDHEGTKRTRLPLHVARRYFNLTGLNRISVYNKAGELVTDATFERVEFLEGEIESEYVAVFKPMSPDWHTKDVSYCITTSNPYKQTPIAVEPLHDKKLATKLIKQFSIDPKKVWKTDHLKFLENKSVWSVIAIDEGSYIIETKETGSTVIFESKAEYSVTEVMPVNIEINKRPALLATVAINDTDWVWSTLLVYKAGWYEVMKTGRIEP